MPAIPEKLPTSLIDRAVYCWQELGLAEFVLHQEMEFGERLDEDILRRALDLLMDAHPVLGCRLVMRPYRPYWHRLGANERANFIIAADEEKYERFKIETMEFEAGPQVKACLHRAPDCDRLLLKVSHIVADAGGTKETAECLADLYTRLNENPRHIPRPNIHGDRGIAQLFRQVPPRKLPIIFEDFLKGIYINPAKPPTLTLPLPEGAPRAPIAFTLRHIEVGRLQQLSAYGRERGATLNDMMLAAAFRALVRTAPENTRASLSIQMTFDYRRWYLPSGRAGGICNLSAFEFPTPGDDIGSSYDDTLARISAFMRRRKARMPGLAIGFLSPLMLALPYPGLRAFFGKVTGGQISQNNYPDTFTNMGPIEERALRFAGQAPRRAWLLAPPVYPPIFGFGMSGYAGTLTLSAGSPLAVVPAATCYMDALLDELPAPGANTGETAL